MKFICVQCGHSDQPCKHFVEREELRILREQSLWTQKALCEIIFILNNVFNRPQSATLKLQANQMHLIGEKQMPASIAVGKTANSLFQEWSGPNGTGTVVPNVG